MSESENNISESETPVAANTYGKTAILNAYTLGAFAVVAALILGTVYVGTKDRIDASVKLAEQRALLAVLGDFSYDNDLLADTLVPTAAEQDILNISPSNLIYVVRYLGEIRGFIFPAVAADGYSGDISMLIGVSLAGQSLGARVVEHKETPGLGDKIDEKKSDWILDFAGKSLSEPTNERWAVTKDGGEFDAFTGATITPRATVERVRSVLEYYLAERESLIARAALNVNSESQTGMNQ